jgi:hypothetical protein
MSNALSTVIGVGVENSKLNDTCWSNIYDDEEDLRLSKIAEQVEKDCIQVKSSPFSNCTFHGCTFSVVQK